MVRYVVYKNIDKNKEEKSQTRFFLPVWCAARYKIMPSLFVVHNLSDLSSPVTRIT